MAHTRKRCFTRPRRSTAMAAGASDSGSSGSARALSLSLLWQITLPVPPEEAVAYICPVCWWENDVFIPPTTSPATKSWADPVPGAGKCPAVRHLQSPDEAVRASEEISSSGMPLGHLNRNPPILALFGVFWFPLWWSVSRIPGESAFSQLSGTGWNSKKGRRIPPAPFL